MTASGLSAAAEALNACRRFEKPEVNLSGGLRTGCTILVFIWLALYFDLLGPGMALSLGILFVGVADMPEAYRPRLRQMAWAAGWCAVTALIGGLVSPYPPVMVLFGFIVAGACGFAAALGPRAALVTTLSLVLFAFYSGNPVTAENALVNAVLIFVGGLIAIAVAIAPMALRRLGAVRLLTSRAYAEFAEATSSDESVSDPFVASHIVTAFTALDHCGAQGRTRAWLEGLLTSLQWTRLALIALTSEGDPGYSSRLARATSAWASAVASAVRRPSQVRRVADALADLERVVAEAPAGREQALATRLLEAAARTLPLLEQPWPIGRRAELAPSSIHQPSPLARLRAHWHRTDPFAEHAFRLSFCFGIAVLFSAYVDVPHAYWVPLTVAWIAKPDLSGTVTRVFMRVAGTIGGVLIFALFALASSSPYVSALFIAFSAGLAVSYLTANYPVAVIGITIVVLGLDTTLGDAPYTTIFERILDTIAAGLWVLAVALIRPRRTASTTLAALHRTQAALRDYASHVRSGEDATSVRAQLVRERAAAASAITAASFEPRGVWERGGPDLEPGDAALILQGQVDTAVTVAAEDLLGEQPESDPERWQRIERDLDALDSRLAAYAAARTD